MKFRVIFKTPDAVERAISEAVENIEDEDEQMDREEEAKVLCQEYFKYGESVTIEMDTDNWTCKVLKVR